MGGGKDERRIVMFKLALNAGHGYNTPGKRCMKKLDPKQTREWVLNSRICEKIEKKLKAYTGYNLIRLDDPTGKKDVALKTRTSSANNFGADFYLSIHHNAGVKGGSGGGIETYTYTRKNAQSVAWQNDLYEAYVRFCNEVGREAHKKQNFMRNIRAQGITEIRNQKREYCWRGIALSKEGRK